MDLLYTIGADASNFNQNVKGLATTAQKASNDVSKSLADAAKQVDNLGGSAISASQKMMQMRSGISAARDGVLAFTVGGQAAERSLLAMGHHINSLVNETGSFKGAMQALGSSLWGPGGIILGLSVAVELFLKWKDRQKEATQTQTEFQKALESSVKTASDELSHLTILYQASQNDNLTRQQRLIAVRELQKEYPAYFGNLSKEAILAGDAAGAYDRLTNSIINSAAAKAGQDALAEQIKPLIQLQAQLQTNERTADEDWARQKRRYEEAQALKAKSDSTSFLRAPTQPQTPGFRTVDLSKPIRQGANNTGFISLEDGDVKSLEEYKKGIQDKIKDNAAAIQSMLEQYGVQTLIKNQGLKDEKGKKIKEPLSLLAELEKALKQAETAYENSIISGKTSKDDADSPLRRKLLAASEAIRKYKEDIAEALLPVGANNNTTDNSIKAIKPSTAKFGDNSELTTMQAQLSLVKENYAAQVALDKQRLKKDSLNAQKEFNAELKNEAKVAREIAHVFGGELMNAFQAALSGTQSFVSAMGQAILQLIEKLVAAAAAAAILAVILNLTGFGEAASFTSLFGDLSGLGSLFKSSSGSTSTGPGINSFATGGIFTQAHAGIFGEAGPEAIVTPKHLQDFAGVSSNSVNGMHVSFDTIQIGPKQNFIARVRSDKYIRRTS